jgi:hypothetical protein
MLQGLHCEEGLFLHVGTRTRDFVVSPRNQFPRTLSMFLSVYHRVLYEFSCCVSLCLLFCCMITEFCHVQLQSRALSERQTACSDDFSITGLC